MPKRGVVEVEIRSLTIGIEGNPGQDLLISSIPKEAGCPPETQIRKNQNTEGVLGQSLLKSSNFPLIKRMEELNALRKNIFYLLKIGLLEEEDLLQEVLKTMIQDQEGALGQSLLKVDIIWIV